MKRHFSLVVILLTLLASCRPGVETRFGIERVSFMAYNWGNATATSQLVGHPVAALWTAAVDTPMAVLVQKYVQVNDSGVCILALRKEWGGPLECTRLHLPLSCDSILKNVERQPLANDYFPPVDYVEIYDGPSFCILIERKDGSRKFIEYSHASIPEALKPIHSFLYDMESPTFPDTPLPLGMQEIADSLGRRDARWIKEMLSRQTVGEPIPIPDPEDSLRGSSF